MSRLSPEQRHLLVDAVKRGIKKCVVAEVFGITCKTVWYWCKRAFHAGKESFRDLPRKPKEGKVSFDVERSILALRNTFDWGCARIQQGLYCLPDFMRKVFVKAVVQGVKLSRTTINNVLTKHDFNGYFNEGKTWKFFRAKEPNEMWQLDPKGPFRVQGKKYWWVICIDDYSRYVVMAKQFEHNPTIKEITRILQPLIKKYHPRNILTDNNPFREEWDEWCKKQNITPLHAHPYYPQDKGKIERNIRNYTEEFIKLLKKFPQWLNGKLEEYTKWFNHKRYHRGIQTTPATLFT